jgi:hypothetical protein
VDDWKIASIMDDLAALYKQPGESEWGHSHSLDDFEDASAARTGCEEDIVQGIYDQMRVSGQWTRYEVCDLGLLTPETSSGNNPEYLYAKLLWWKQFHSMQGLEAIIRHQLEQVRGLRSPELLMSLEDEVALNAVSVEHYGMPPQRAMNSLRARAFASALAMPVGYRHDHVELWCEQVPSHTQLLSPSIFYVEYGMDHEEYELRQSHGKKAYQKLLKYQNTQERGTKSHDPIPDWARPQL